MIDSTRQIVRLAVDFYEHLIKVSAPLAKAAHPAYPLLAKISPRLLLKLLFTGAGGKDPELLQQADTQVWLADIQRACFKHGTRSYVRDVNLYVEPWATELDSVTAAVRLWHGDADNWAPIAMSSYLQEHLRNAHAVIRCAEQAHYSCLLENAEAVMATVQQNSTATRAPG